METTIKPDKKYYTKIIWVLISVSIGLAIVVAITNLIISIAGGNPNTKEVLWWICLVCILLLWIVVYPLLNLWIKNLNYIIQEDRVTIHKGILTKTKQNIPFRGDYRFYIAEITLR